MEIQAPNTTVSINDNDYNKEWININIWIMNHW